MTSTSGPINIRRETSHIAAEDVSNRVTGMVAELSKQMELSTTWDEHSSSILFTSNSGMAKGANGHLQIGPGWIDLVVRLPMLLQVQKASVEKEIVKVLDETLK